MSFNLIDAADEAAPIWPVACADLEAWRTDQPGAIRDWLERTGFAAKEGEQALVPTADGGLAGVALGLGDGPGLWSPACQSPPFPCADAIGACGQNYICNSPALVDQLDQALGRRHAVAVVHEVLDHAPLQAVDIEANADPAVLADVGRHEEALGVAADEHVLRARSPLHPDGDATVARRHHREHLVADTEGRRIVATERLLVGLREPHEDFA